MPLAHKVFAVTGAASGIGRATAELLASRGALLSLADINATQLEATAEHIRTATRGDKASVFTWTLDVCVPDDCQAWIAATVAHFGQPLAGAANLAGVFGPNIGRPDTGALRSITDSEFERVMTINVAGTLNCLRAELANMAEADAGGGAIVNAASVAGLRGGVHNGPYTASKHAVVGLTRTAALEEGTRGIRVNAVAPGIIATPMITQIEAAYGSTELIGQGDPGVLGRKGEAREVAHVISFLLGSESSFITGVVIPVDGGWTA